MDLSCFTSPYESILAKEAYARFSELFPEGSHARKFENVVDLRHVWTRILAFTPNKVPEIGAILELTSVLIPNDHGIANIFAWAPGVVKLILGAALYYWDAISTEHLDRKKMFRLRVEIVCSGPLSQ